VKKTLSIITFLATAVVAFGGALEFTWPTLNDAWAAGKGPEAYILSREVGNTESGQFGCTLNNGMLFHDGIDLKPLQRDWMDEPTDPVRSIMPGVVRYINRDRYKSDWGFYIVIEHHLLEPKLLSVYGHLRSLPYDLKVGQMVDEGQVIGTLGRSNASTNQLPKAEAHLHFEVALRLSNTFPQWYSRQEPADPNNNDIWHPRNLIAVDFLDLVESLKEGETDSIQQYFFMESIAVSLKVQSLKKPDFIRRYPELIGERSNQSEAHGWQINFNAYGFPVAWRTLTKDEVTTMGPNLTEVVYHDSTELMSYPCHELVEANWQGTVVPAPRLLEIVNILFDL
jgi:murein DD-endopeptidase MepM/ murein hydrolase activator NlpD